MNIRLLIIGLLLFSVFSNCKKKSADLPTDNRQEGDELSFDLEKAESKQSNLFDDNYKIELSGDTILFMDAISGTPLEFGSNFNELVKDFSTTKRPIENKYFQGRYDTIVSLESDNDFVSFYKMPDKQVLLVMRLNTNKIKLKRDLRIGMKKSEFYIKFGQLDTLKDLKNHINIWDPYSNLQFTFIADTLNKIVYSGDID
jgi:hypothetical protein